MRRLTISLAIALAAFLVGIILSQYYMALTIPIIMASYVAALLYLNAKVKPSGDESSGATAQKSLPPQYAPFKVFASGIGLLFVGVLLLALLLGVVLLLSGGLVE